MKCILIFNKLNDIVYIKYNSSFAQHVLKLAKEHGLISEYKDGENDTGLFSADLVMQLFSPLITSQRVMSNHFSNGYSYIRCTDETNIGFEEYMGHLFIYISNKEIRWLKRVLATCICIIKRVCGLDVSLLKTNNKRRHLVNFLLDTWYSLYNIEQYMLVEAVEQLYINTQLAASTIKALEDAVERLKSVSEFNQIHALIMVNNKFLSLYSSRNAVELTAGDLLFLSMLGNMGQEPSYNSEAGSHVTSSICSDSEYEELESEEDCETFYSTDGSRISSVRTSTKSYNSDYSSQSSIQQSSGIGEETLDYTNSFIFLLGKQNPHAVHLSYISQGIPLFLIHEIGNGSLNTALIEILSSFTSLHAIHNRSVVDKELIRSNVDSIEVGLKKIVDVFKKKLPSHTNKLYSPVIKNVIKKWEPVKKKYQEYVKSPSLDLLLKVEASVENIISILKNMYTNCMLDDSLANDRHDIFSEVGQHVHKVLTDFTEFFQVKSTRNFTLASKSTLSINKYLEEFPGLVHFLYIDRNTHRLVAPSIEFSSEETTALTKKKIWWMVDFCRPHLEEGRFCLMWKDTVFSYSYFLWFEDASGTPVKPKISPSTVIKGLPPVGVLCGNFYNQLIEKCFPKCAPNKIRCFELYCIHLGLVSSSCVLEHCRRLTATIWEVTGVPTNPLDVLF